MNVIHFVGYSATHPSTFGIEIPVAPEQYTLLLVSTPVQFCIDGQWREYPAGTAMLYAPCQPICYRACRDTYQDDWLRFSSDDPLITQFPLTGVPFAVSDTEYCHHLIKLLTWETSLASPDSDRIVSDLLEVLFLRLRQDTFRKETASHAAQLLNLHKEIYNNPHLPWNIHLMARQIHLSAGYLQILYKKMFGISCMDDVIVCRIRMAREQLAYTEKPVAEIAEICGYHNVEHFCRQFRQQTGMTPRAFRRGTKSVPVSGGEQKEAALGSSPETACSGYTEPAPFISLSHYNVAGSDMPDTVYDEDGNILPPPADLR